MEWKYLHDLTPLIKELNIIDGFWRERESVFCKAVTPDRPATPPEDSHAQMKI